MVGECTATCCDNNNGNYNVAIGYCALRQAKCYGQSGHGSNNIAIGRVAGVGLTSGKHNIFLGEEAGGDHGGGSAEGNIIIGKQSGEKIDGSCNVLIGQLAGCSCCSNAGANQNVIIGQEAGRGITLGCHNVFLGTSAGMGVTGGCRNVAIGWESACNSAWTGDYNTFVGTASGRKITTGDNNAFVGRSAGHCVTTGSYNVSVGDFAGSGFGTNDAKTGSCNVSIGRHAGYKLSGATACNTLVGAGAGCLITTGSNNVVIGQDAGQSITSADHQLAVGIGNSSWIVGNNNFNITTRTIIPESNNSYNLGTTAVRWANIYTNDLQLSNKGSVNDIDGTWGDFTVQEGENDLFLINNRSGKKYKFNLTEVS
jgi:hypothetical protein